MPKISLSTGRQFSSHDGQTLLDAANQAEVVFPYSCKTGRCSSCKCKVLSGETHALHDELGLTEREKADGWILSCVRSAITDTHLETEDFGNVVLPSVKKMPCRIHALQKMTQDIIKVVLRLPPSEFINFFPGQYIDIIGQGGVRRSYSLANTKVVNNLLELHIRYTSGGVMSEYWFNNAKLADLLWLNGPFGTFFLRDIAQKELIFLATGTGFAPVRSMLEHIETLSAEQSPQSITFYWGGRTPDDLYWDMSSIAGRVQYVPVLSRANGDWLGARGYVQDILISNKQNFADAVVYACGSDAMIHSAKERLIAAGLHGSRFFSDAFVCSASS